MSRSRRAVATLGRLAIAAAIAGLATGVSACEAGNNAPTLQFHPQSAGLDAQVGGIRINDAFVLGAPSGALPARHSAGLFLSLYNQGDSPDMLVHVSAPDVARQVNIPHGGIDLPSQQAVNLTAPHPVIVLAGLLHPLEAGRGIRVVFTFARVGTRTLTIPVLPRSGSYATFSPAPSPSPSPSPGNHGTTATPTASPTATATG